MTSCIDTPLLITGGGVGALIVGQITSGASLGSLIVGHRCQVHADNADAQLEELDAKSTAILQPHGVLNVLIPYAVSAEPLVIDRTVFEKVLKHHCVVNMNITVYDDMKISNLVIDGETATAVLSDDKHHWTLRADRVAETSTLSANLNNAIQQGAALAQTILAGIKN